MIFRTACACPEQAEGSRPLKIEIGRDAVYRVTTGGPGKLVLGRVVCTFGFVSGIAHLPQSTDRGA